jgi:hypothetical protein
MYQQMIREALTQQGHIEIDSRWIEGWMRLEHGCLDSLPRRQFDAEVGVAVKCIANSTAEQNEELAQSYGL